MVLQYSKLFQSKLSTRLLRQDSECSCSFGKIQNLGDLEYRIYIGDLDLYIYKDNYISRLDYIYIYIYTVINRSSTVISVNI